MRFLTLAAVLIFLLGAAGLAHGQGMSPPNPPDSHIADGSLQRALDDAQRRWKAAGVRSYRYEIERSCFCGRQTLRLVIVRGGVIKRHPPGMKSVATIPRLFGLIQGAIDGGASRITATYGKRGVPREIYVDRVLYVSDEETGYSTRRFTPLKQRAR